MVPPEGADSGATQKGMLSATAAANSGQVNAALAYLATLHSPQSRKSVASKLNVFARWTGAADLRDCRWGEMKTEHVLAFLAKQERDGISGSTSNCYLAALKGVAQAAWLARSMEHEDYLRIKSLKQRRIYRLLRGARFPLTNPEIFSRGAMRTRRSAPATAPSFHSCSAADFAAEKFPASASTSSISTTVPSP